MSASTRLTRSRVLAGPQSPIAEEPKREWIGVDFSASRGSGRSYALVPLLVVALVAALGVAALRIDLIRARYAVAAAMEMEQALLEEQRALIVRKRQMRDPVELAVQARARGFRPPSRVFSLVEPQAAGSHLRATGFPLPEVAAATHGGRAR
jgi:hypothetical protein